jgi:hypothetical protein
VRAGSHSLFLSVSSLPKLCADTLRPAMRISSLSPAQVRPDRRSPEKPRYP